MLFVSAYQPVRHFLIPPPPLPFPTSSWVCLRSRPRPPSQVEPQVLEDAPAGQEGAAKAGQELPAAQVARAARLWHLGRLLDELAVQLVPQGAQVVPCLQDALDDGDGVRHRLQLLQGVEDLDGLVLKGGVAFVLEH